MLVVSWRLLTSLCCSLSPASHFHFPNQAPKSSVIPPRIHLHLTRRYNVEKAGRVLAPHVVGRPAGEGLDVGSAGCEMQHRRVALVLHPGALHGADAARRVVGPVEAGDGGRGVHVAARLHRIEGIRRGRRQLGHLVALLAAGCV